MKHPIDPKIDCVFKALLGRRSNRRLLRHFLNAMLAEELPAPLETVEILNPYNAQDFLTDKLTIVDVKARDDEGRSYQIEIQLLTHPDLPARILYGWADLYSAQLEDGDDYAKLRPAYALWLLGRPLRRTTPGYVHRFRMRDAHGKELVPHGGIWLFELSKFAARRVRSERERWLKFFVEGERLDADRLPTWMRTSEMEQAMKTLKAFSEKQRAYHAYQTRLDAMRVQRSLDRQQQALEAAAEQARADARQAQIETKQAQIETKQAQIEAEQARADAQRARAAEEQARAAEEQARAAEEQARAAEEQARAAEEQARAAEEQARAAEEQIRTEARRIQAEIERERAAKEAALAELARLQARVGQPDR